MHGDATSSCRLDRTSLSLAMLRLPVAGVCWMRGPEFRFLYVVPPRTFVEKTVTFL